MSDATPGPGAIVRAQRELRGLTQQDIADTLNLGARVVEDMEAENWTRLPAPAFTRGYLRAYAKLLDIDPDTSHASVRCGGELAGETRRSASGHVDAAIAPQGARDLSQKHPGVVLTGAVARCDLRRRVVLWAVWPDARGERARCRKTASGSGRSGDSETRAGRGADRGNRHRRHRDATAPAATSPGNASVVAASAGRGTGAHDDQGAHRITSDGDDRLKFAFTDECWVEIKDAHGSSIYQRLERVRRSRSSWSGRPPFHILLGNAPARDAGVQRRACGVVAAHAQQRRHAGARAVRSANVQSISGMRDMLPPEVRRWQHVERTPIRVARVVRLRRNPPAAARTNGTVQSRSRRSNRRRREGNVQPARPRRRAVVAAAGRYGELRAGVSAARTDLQSDATPVVSRADVPLRAAAEGPLSAVRTDRRGSIRHGGPGRRCRADPVVARRCFRRSALHASCASNSTRSARPKSRASYRDALVAYLTPLRDATRRRQPTPSGAQSAAHPRQQRSGDAGAARRRAGVVRPPRCRSRRRISTA